MRKTIRNNKDIVGSINCIAQLVPGLREPEIVGFAFAEMAEDLKRGLIDDLIWNDLARIDFKDETTEFADTRGITIEDEDWTTVLESYMVRDEVKRAPLAYVTKLVLAYVRQKKMEKEKNPENIVDIARDVTNSNVEVETVDANIKKDYALNFVRLEMFIELLKKDDPKSVSKIEKIDEILKK